MFLSTIMKIVVERKETMGTTKWCHAQDPRLSEEAKAVAQRLGRHEIQLWYITALQMSFFFLCVAALNNSAKVQKALSKFGVLLYDE